MRGKTIQSTSRVSLPFDWNRLETWLAGPLAPDVRTNMRTELVATVVYGAFATSLSFIPLVLRRLGASADLLALYAASAYLGNVLAGLGLHLARLGHPKRTAVICWVLSRSVFLGVAFVTRDVGLLILAAIFWLVEGLPSPIYSGIIQSIYPVEVRGRTMAVVRLGMALSMLTLAPVAGWILDGPGYRVLFSLAGAIGVLSSLIFSRLRVNAPDLQLHRTMGASHVNDILLHDRRYALCLAGIVLFGLSSLIPTALYPIVQVDRLQLTYSELGWLTLAMSLGRLISTPVHRDRSPGDGGAVHRRGDAEPGIFLLGGFCPGVGAEFACATALYADQGAGSTLLRGRRCDGFPRAHDRGASPRTEDDRPPRPAAG